MFLNNFMICNYTWKDFIKLWVCKIIQYYKIELLSQKSRNIIITVNEQTRNTDNVLNLKFDNRSIHCNIKANNIIFGSDEL